MTVIVTSVRPGPVTGTGVGVAETGTEAEGEDEGEGEGGVEGDAETVADAVSFASAVPPSFPSPPEEQPARVSTPDAHTATTVALAVPLASTMSPHRADR
ncbi:hypothetical protein JCM4814A_06880 [Streptomyces phaeofaciens JCM 4814]|uniref:Uncharacterized protein n=1 Tax=Streptomyces phaeofaciens TaxID=68254 RepID=A0A918LWU3_9ACTN|nr:hypothetical protein [Streptomyces phaeofaciens]GGT65353.1 hypothetical protein GCM10010226_48780 [Streptomyces phaeofaciens]